MNGLIFMSACVCFFSTPFLLENINSFLIFHAYRLLYKHESQIHVFNTCVNYANLQKSGKL